MYMYVGGIEFCLFLWFSNGILDYSDRVVFFVFPFIHGRYWKPITPLENRICEKCFSDEIESEEHLLLKCSFYYTSRRKLLETIKNNINHSNFEKFSFGYKFIWLLNSESKDTLICMCNLLLKSHCFG